MPERSSPSRTAWRTLLGWLAEVRLRRLDRHRGRVRRRRRQVPSRGLRMDGARLPVRDRPRPDLGAL